MKRVALLLILFLVSACGGAPASTAASETKSLNAPLATPTLPFAEGGEGITSPTATFIVFPTAPPITPTETSLPPLELPTSIANPPALMVWDGLPTYIGDSLPGYYFRVRYDPEIWALTTDDYGFPALGHRGIDYCVISPASGGGLPSSLRVDHDFRRLGAITYEIGTAYTAEGVKQFVTYFGGDGNIFTSFVVNFQSESDLCLQEAEVVLATLTSVSKTQATPATQGP